MSGVGRGKVKVFNQMGIDTGITGSCPILRHYDSPGTSLCKSCEFQGVCNPGMVFECSKYFKCGDKRINIQ